MPRCPHTRLIYKHAVSEFGLSEISPPAASSVFVGPSQMSALDEFSFGSFLVKVKSLGTETAENAS